MKSHFANHRVNATWIFFIIAFTSINYVFAQQSVKIMPLGDSITSGVGSTNSSGYRGPLHDLLTTEGIVKDFVGSQSGGTGFTDTQHEGHPGETADFILTNINTYLQAEFNNLGAQEIGIILLHIGTNDITVNETPESTRDSIRDIIDAINSFNPNIYIILSSLIPRNDSDGGVKDAQNSILNNFIEELYLNKRNAGIRILYAGMNELFKCNANWATDYLGDTVHPTDSGYALMAAVWFNRIMNAINNTDLTVTDNFERSFLGDMWDADSQYLIQNGDLVNTATTGQQRWEYLAAFKGQRSPSTASIRWGANSDVLGLEQAGIAIFLDSASKDASGYLAWITPSNNFLNLWTITNGITDQSLGSAASQAAIPGPNDVFRIDVSKNATNLTFNYYVNDVFAGTILSPNPGVNDEYFSGFISAHNLNNDVAEFSVAKSPDTILPSPVQDLAAGAITAHSVQLIWTASGDDGNQGTASRTDLRYSRDPITANNFDLATEVLGIPNPSQAGVQETFVVSGLNSGALYYFALKIIDDAGNSSTISNVVNATTVADVQFVDNFNRVSLGADWTADPTFQIVGGELSNTSSDGNNFDLAILNARKNPVGAAFKWGQNADATGISNGGLAVMMDSPNPTASGYLVTRRVGLNEIRLWTIENGNITIIDTEPNPNLPHPTAGQEFRVMQSSDASGHYFDLFIDGQFDGRVEDTQKLQGNVSDLYAGVLLFGNSSNNIDDFTLFLEGGSPSNLQIVAGQSQTGTVSQVLPIPLTVSLSDDNGNPVQGANIDFEVTAGGGSLDVPPPSEHIILEAEIASLDPPMVVGNDQLASGNQFIFVPNGGGGQETGMASIPFFIKDAGNYVIWGRAIYPNDQSNSFWVRIDSGTEYLWDVGQRTDFSNVWEWDQVSSRTPKLDPLVFSLTAGQHTLFIREGKDGAQLDQIVITKENSGFVPVDPVVGGGTFTDVNGEASANFTLGPTPGVNTVQVTFGSFPPVIFTATGTPDVPESLNLVSGNNQAGTAGQPLSNPFKVRVLGEFGTLIVNHNVTFTVTSGGGNFNGSNQITVQTDTSGIAQATMTLGPTLGGTNQAQATALQGGVPLTGSPITFTATAGTPDRLEAISNINQNGTVNLPLADSVEVRVLDSSGNPLPGFPVDFGVITEGGFEQGQVNGSIGTVTIFTNSGGIAKAEWRLGPTAGTNNNRLRVSASVANGSPIDFTASAQVGSASKLVELSGNDQSGMVQTDLTEPFIVKITDASDNPVASWPVKFKVIAGGGKFSAQDSTTVPTNASGEASATLTLGSEAGTPQNPFNNIVEVSAENNQPLTGSPITFKASAVATGASDLEVVGGDNQIGPAAEALPQAISVKVTDGPPASNPIANHSVRFRITAGGGTINNLTTTDTTITTNSSGIASVDWYMGGNLTANAQKLEVSATDGINNLNGSPKVFQATATAGAVDPEASFLTANPDTLPADGIAKTTITVTLTDKFGNRIPGKPITLNSSGNNNIFEQPQEVTNANGQVTGRLSSISAEVKTVSAKIIGGISLTAFTNVVFTPLNPDKVVTNGGDNQTGNVGTALDDPIEVLVTDVNNNIVPNVDVTFAVNSGGGHLIDEASGSEGQSVTVQTDNQGIARSLWVLGSNPGNNTVNATVTYQGSALTGSPRNFTAIGVNATATTIVLFDGGNQTGGVAGGTLPKPLQVKVTDANNKPVFNVPVDFEIQLGGGMLANESPVTNYKGIAETKFTLGPIVGTNIVQASNSSLSGSPIVFTFQSVVGPPAILKAVSGHGGNAVVNSLYPIAAKIMDINKNPIQGVHANFEVVQGGASIEGSQNVQTDADGIAQAQVRLPTVVDTVIVKVSSNDLPGFFDTFMIFAESAAAANLSEAGGNNQEGTIGRELVFPLQVLVSDPFGNPVSGYTVNWVRTIGNGSPSNTSSTTNSKGIASLNYTIGNQLGTNEVRAIAALNPGQMTFTATGVTNNFPLFTDLTNKSVVEGNQLEFTVSATDADNDPITYEAQNLPNGAEFNANTATFSWTPPLGSYGDFEITFVARDNRGGLDSETITITVQNSNNPPVVNSHNPSDFTVQFNFGDIIPFSVDVIDPDNDEINYQWFLFTDFNSTGTLVSTSPDFEFITSNFNPGTFIIRVEITDGRDTKILQWQLALVVSVDLASFSAAFEGFQGAEIIWTTSRESDNLGFDVLRSRSENGTYMKLNDDLIPSRSDGEYKFVDTNVDVGVRYYYILEDVNVNGARTQHGPISLDITAPETFEISQNYPNPFNPNTKIRYQLPVDGNVKIKIFDILGRRVKVLLDETKEAGFHEITWDARNDAGRKVSTGIYYYQIISGDFKETKKMILMK